MKQKGGKFQSNYKMEHISNINGVVNQNKIIAKGNDSGINIITQKNNNKPEHIFINLDQFVNKLDRGENDMFFKLRQLMDKEEHKSHPLILKNSFWGPCQLLDSGFALAQPWFCLGFAFLSWFCCWSCFFFV